MRNMVLAVFILFVSIGMVKAPTTNDCTFKTQSFSRISRNLLAGKLTCAEFFSKNQDYFMMLLTNGEKELREIAYCTKSEGCLLSSCTSEQEDACPIQNQSGSREITIPTNNSVLAYSCRNYTHEYVVIVDVPRHSPVSAAPSIDRDIQSPDIAPPSFDSQAHFTSSSENIVSRLPVTSEDAEEETIDIVHTTAYLTAQPTNSEDSKTDPVIPYKAATIALSIFSGLTITYITVKVIIHVIQNGLPKCDAEYWCSIIRCICKHRPKVSNTDETATEDNKNKIKRKKACVTVEADETNIEQIIESILEIV